MSYIVHFSRSVCVLIIFGNWCQPYAADNHACSHVTVPNGIIHQNLLSSSHWQHSMQCLLYLMSFHCPLQYHFRFVYHIFSTANKKQLLKLNSLIGLQHYIIPGSRGTVAQCPPGIVQCTTCLAIEQPCTTFTAQTEGLDLGYLCLLFRDGQLSYINQLLQKGSGFSYRTLLWI